MADIAIYSNNTGTIGKAYFFSNAGISNREIVGMQNKEIMYK